MSSRSNMSDPLRKRTWWTLVSYAFFRLESALTIAMTLILIVLFPHPFVWWQWWYWLVLGGVAEVLIVYSSVTDPQTGQRLVADMLREQYNPRTLHNVKNRKRLEKALDYHHRMGDLMRQSEEGVLRDRLQDTVDGVDKWIANMYHLSARLDAYESDKVIARDMQAVPEALDQLSKRLTAERNPAVRSQLEATLSSKKAHWENLQELQARMEKADLQMEKTLADLGNVYSQLRQIEARDMDSGRAQRLAQNISDQVATLQDIVDAMDEVYSVG